MFCKIGIPLHTLVLLYKSLAASLHSHKIYLNRNFIEDMEWSIKHTRLTRYIFQALIYDLRSIAFTTKYERHYY